MNRDLQMAQRIAQEVSAVGGRAYFVGGYVRDSILKKENKDIDLEIHGVTEPLLLEILQKLGQPITMGKSFGVFNLRGFDLDIAMPCGKDRQADPFLGTKQAAMRRDLTINAMMQDVLTGEVLDYFGGKHDLGEGVIRHVDDATFAEDPLRVLRVAQFAARFGFCVAEETLTLCRKLSLKDLPRERVWAETEKALLKSEKPSVYFETLQKMEQLDVWFPELKELIGIEQNPVYHPEGDVWTHTMMVLDAAATLRCQAADPLGLMTAAVCHDLGKITATVEIDGVLHAYDHENQGMAIAGRFLRRLTAERKLHSYVANMVRLHMRPNVAARQKSGVKSMCKLFDQSILPEDLLLLAKADHLGKLHSEDYEETERFLQKHLAVFHERMARPYVMGADLLQAGFTPGEKFKEALDYAHKLRLAGVSKESALRQTAAFLRKLRDK